MMKAIRRSNQIENCCHVIHTHILVFHSHKNGSNMKETNAWWIHEHSVVTIQHRIWLVEPITKTAVWSNWQEDCHYTLWAHTPNRCHHSGEVVLESPSSPPLKKKEEAMRPHHALLLLSEKKRIAEPSHIIVIVIVAIALYYYYYYLLLERGPLLPLS